MPRSVFNFGRLRSSLAAGWGGRGPIYLLISLGLLLVATIAAGSLVVATTFRERALQVAFHDIENNAKLLSRHFDYRFNDFSVLQDAVVDKLRHLPQETAQDDLAGSQIHQWLRAKVSGSSDIAGVNIFDAKGNLINSSERWPTPPINVADREYFLLLSQYARLSSKIEILQGRFAPGPAIVFARSIRSPLTNAFLGIVTRAVDPSVLLEFFASVSPGGKSSLALFQNDGTLLARYPEAASAVGRKFDLTSLYTRPSQSLKSISPVDGVERLMAVHSLANFPLSIVVTNEADSALADWRTQTKFLIAAAGLAALIIGIVLRLIIRQLLFQHKMARRHLSTALNNMTQGLISYDSAERVVLCNDRYLDMCGLSRQHVKPGSTLTDILKFCQTSGSLKGDVGQFRQDLLDHLKPGQVYETLSETSDGRYFHGVNKPSWQGGWVTTLQDITERTHSERRILHLAQHDHLTGLPNRDVFREHLEKSLDGLAADRELALIYIDIDQFKHVNDTLGHPVGDAYLRSIASRLSECLSDGDFIARLAGDEFAVVHRVRAQPTVEEFLSSLFDALRRPHPCGDHIIPADASVGIAIAPKDGATWEELVKNADLAMYAAKTHGRRSYRFYSAAMDADAKFRRALEIDLRNAIPRGELETYYQPVVDLQSGKIVGCEALLRWRRPDGNFVPPSTFIPLAEETGLVVQLGDWVLKAACLEAASWPQDVTIAVNVSPVQLRCPTLPLTLAAALGASGLSPHRLELEITEAVLIGDDEAALEVLHNIKSLGIRVSLDDFGTGYSSLSYLRRFPFDKIKIDKSFIKDIATAGGASAIVEAVVKIAKDHGMATTAEGVETEEQLRCVRQLGCTQMQGYLFSLPKPGLQIRQLIRDVLALPNAAA